MNSEASDSPLKSSASENLSKSTGTTSVPEISSLSSLSTPSKNELVALRNKVQLLQAQIRQKNVELEKQTMEKGKALDEKREMNFLKLKCDVLSSACDDLMTLIERSEVENERRVRELESIFTRSNQQQQDIARNAQEEKAQLKAQLRSTETKISTIVHENAFLRWENGALSEERSALKAKIEEEVAMNTTLRTELNKLRSAHSSCMDRERRTSHMKATVDRCTATMETMKRIQDDREKEYGITLTEMRNEVEFLKGENGRKEEVAKGLVEMLDRLTNDNNELRNRIQDKENLRVSHIRSTCRNVVQDLEEITGGMREESMRQLRQRVATLAEECAEERQWRRELCAVHVEMSKDMKRLMHMLTHSCTHTHTHTHTKPA